MYHVDITGKAGGALRVKSKDYEFLVDTKGNGATPPDTLLAALGTCIGVYLRKYAEGSKIELGDFDISVDADFSKEPPVSFRKINVSLNLRGAVLDERRRKAMLEFIRNCPVHNTLKADPEIAVSIK